MPFFGARRFHPLAAKNHLAAAEAFVKAELREGDSITPLKLVSENTNDAGAVAKTFVYSTLNDSFDDVGTNTIAVIQYRGI
jgi:hypothetical protein